MHNKGNVLFLILLAVALFAALSYAVTQAGRSGGKDISDEDARLGASRLLQYLSNVEQAAMRMRLSKGLRPEQLDFGSNQNLQTNGATLDYYNGACTNNRCHVFHPEGGGIEFQHFEDISMIDPLPTGWGATWTRPGHHTYRAIIVEGIGSSAAEIVLSIGGVKIEICEAFNDLLGIEHSPGYDLTGDQDVHLIDTYATFLARDDVWHFGDNISTLAGKDAFCIPYAGEVGLVYKVVVPR